MTACTSLALDPPAGTSMLPIPSSSASDALASSAGPLTSAIDSISSKSPEICRLNTSSGGGASGGGGFPLFGSPHETRTSGSSNAMRSGNLRYFTFSLRESGCRNSANRTLAQEAEQLVIDRWKHLVAPVHTGIASETCRSTTTLRRVAQGRPKNGTPAAAVCYDNDSVRPSRSDRGPSRRSARHTN